MITQHGWPNLDLILTAVLTAHLSTSIPSISHKISSLVSNIAVLFSSVLKFGFCHFLTFCSLYNRVELGWVETWMPGTCISYRELVVLSFFGGGLKTSGPPSKARFTDILNITFIVACYGWEHTQLSWSVSGLAIDSFVLIRTTSVFCNGRLFCSVWLKVGLVFFSVFLLANYI